MGPVNNRLSEDAINARPRQTLAADIAGAGTPRPPIPEAVHVDGEGEAFGGTNPWSGPYLVFAVLGLVALIAVIFAIATWVQ